MELPNLGTKSHVPCRLGTKGEILSHTNLLAVRTHGFPAGIQYANQEITQRDDYFKWYRSLKAIVENYGECAIPFGNPCNTVHSNL